MQGWDDDPFCFEHQFFTLGDLDFAMGSFVSVTDLYCSLCYCCACLQTHMLGLTKSLRT